MFGSVGPRCLTESSALNTTPSSVRSGPTRHRSKLDYAEKTKNTNARAPDGRKSDCCESFMTIFKNASKVRVNVVGASPADESKMKCHRPDTQADP